MASALLEPGLRTLIDGRQVWSDSSEWRHECLARSLLNDYSPLMRAQMLAQIGANNGGEGATVVERLRATMAAIEEGASE